MSEYWVSKKKYWCQYCEIYIADDAPSRAQHENGLRHKGNKDRFIRSLYKSGVKKKQESEEEKREMKRVEEAAQAAYARDIGAGLVTPGASTSKAPAPTPAPKPKPPPPKPSDPYANYTTAASLGITDPELDRLIAEAEVRKSEGRAGDWVSVVPPPPPLLQDSNMSVVSAGVDAKVDIGHIAGGVRKRVEEPTDDDDTHRFKMRKKTVVVGLGEIYDPGIIRVKPRAERDVQSELASISASVSLPIAGPALGDEIVQGDTGSQKANSIPKATEKPAWIRREWKRTGEDQGGISTTVQSSTFHSDGANPEKTPQESASVITRQDADGNIRPELDIKKEELLVPPSLSNDSSGGSLFRKRKVPAGSAKGRRQV